MSMLNMPRLRLSGTPAQSQLKPINRTMALLGIALKLVPALLLGACQTLLNEHRTSNNSTAPVINLVAPSSRERVQGTENILPKAFQVDIPSTHKLWGRIRNGFAISQLGGNAFRLQSIHEKWYRERPEHLERVFTRAQLYLFDIVEATEQSGLPLEVALLPAVESAFMPTASSSAAADGLWQFIAPTARRYDLKVHLFLDQRRDVRAATRAALRYLQDLRLRYGGDMQLALAAYNCGEGCIDEHIRRAKARGLQGRFEDLELNRETANYVPRLLALTKLVAEGVDSNRMSQLGLPPMQNAPYFAAVTIRRDIDVNRAAKLCGLSLQEFKALNPQHKKPVIVAATNAQVLVPVEHAAGFQEAVNNYRGALSSWTTVKIAQRSSTQKLAKLYGADVEAIRMVNNIPKAHLVVAGSTLLVPKNSVHNDIPATSVESAVLITTPEMVVRKLMVRKNEGWPGVAKRLGVELAQLRAWNPKIKLPRKGTIQLRLPATLEAASPHQGKSATRDTSLLNAKSQSLNGKFL